MWRTTADSEIFLRRPLTPFEILDRALVLERGLSGGKGAEVAALASARIFLERIKPEFSVGELADHNKILRGHQPNGKNPRLP